MNTSWTSCTIQDLQNKGEAELKTGPFGTQLHASDYVETGTPVINVRNIGFGEIREEKLEFIAEETVQRLSSHLLEPGDIVFGRKGAVERHAFINQKYTRWFQGSDCLRLRVKSPSVDSRFLSYYFLTEHHKQWMINQCSHGATMASLNQAIISRILLLLPSIHTQRKIISILSAYDDLIENNTRRIEILEEMARSLYREWFVNFRFPGHEQVKMVDSELGLIPEGWEPVKLGDIAQDIRRSINPDQIDPDTPYFGLEHLPRKSIALSEWGTVSQVQSTKLIFHKGEILFGNEIAQDIVTHFLGRGYQGKAMVVSIDRFTAVKMYNKVQHYWQQQLTELQNQLTTASESEQEQLAAKIQYIEETDMGVVMSSSQNEEEAFNKKGLTIKPHRQRLAKEKPGLDVKFKDASNPLRIVFVCAMWMTGFDAPSCSTIYLDKPMRNHTLMQTIARANRVFGEKVNGLIVDYIGVFRDLQRALAIYGSASGGGVEEGDTPVQSKEALVDELRKAIAQTLQFCSERGINFDQIQTTTQAFARTKLWKDAVEAILVNDDSKQRYLALTQNVTKLYKAILPDPAAGEFNPTLYAFSEITKRIRHLTPQVDISEVKAAVEEILDESIGTLKYVIPESNQLIDLSQIDFDALIAQFDRGYKHTEAEKLKGAIASQLTQMVRLNKSRMNYLDKFQQMIDEYNAGSRNVETFFTELVEFAQELKVEDKRAIAENLEEEELAIVDLLTKPDISLTEKEKLAVKKVAKELLDTLKQEKLVLDWRRRQQSKAAVKVAIEEILDQLPESYSTDVYQRKCEEVYQHVYESYSGAGRSIYNTAA